MADGAWLSLDAAQLGRDGDAIVRRYLTAGTRTIAAETKALERALEAATQAAVPGRLWRAWDSESYPKNGKPARDPSGNVFVNGNAAGRSGGAMTFWTEPGAIRAKNGGFLAIPLPAAGPRGRARNLTPGEWERAHPGVRLRFVYRPGRASLLVADGGVLNVKSGTFRPSTSLRAKMDAANGRAVRHQATVAIFALVPLVRFRNALAVEPLVAAARARLPATLFREIEMMNGGDR